MQALTRLDNGATPISPSANHDGLPTRTVEYHRPSRNSALYSAGTDVSLGMVSTSQSNSVSSSPRVVNQGSIYPTTTASDRNHAPSAYRSPPPASAGYENGPSMSAMQPTRPAPAPPGGGLTRRESSSPASPAHNYPIASSSSRPSLPERTFSKSATNSPNPASNPSRYSTGHVPATHLPPAMTISSSNNGGGTGAPPTRPSRAGTLPLDQQLNMNGVGNLFRDANPLSPSIASARSPSAQTPSSSQFLNHPPPPLHHQPFSAPGNPYAAAAGLDRDFEEKVGLGMGQPMGVVEPRDKDLPKEPITMGRNRSGTGKSSKDKKSVFGVLSGTSWGADHR